MPNKPIRLPPLKALRVRNPNRPEENPCVAIMSSVLSTSRSAIPSHAIYIRMLAMI